MMIPRRRNNRLDRPSAAPSSPNHLIAAALLARFRRVEGRGVELVDDGRAVAADPFEAFAGRAFRRPGGD